MGSGLRLLPLIGGLVVGAIPADRIAPRDRRARLTVAPGSPCSLPGWRLGAGDQRQLRAARFVAGVDGARRRRHGAGDGDRVVGGAVRAVRGATAAIGSAVLQAVNKTGGPLGTAVLGSVLSSAYLARLQLGRAAGARPRTRRARAIFGASRSPHRLALSGLAALGPGRVRARDGPVAARVRRRSPPSAPSLALAIPSRGRRSERTPRAPETSDPTLSLTT